MKNIITCSHGNGKGNFRHAHHRTSPVLTGRPPPGRTVPVLYAWLHTASVDETDEILKDRVIHDVNNNDRSGIQE